MSKDTISVNMNVYDIPILVEQLEKANKEIKILKEEYMILQNASDEVEEEKDKEIERLNNIINKAIDKAKTMKASILIDTIDGIEIDSKFVDDLFALIEYMENELKGVDKE